MTTIKSAAVIAGEIADATRFRPITNADVAGVALRAIEADRAGRTDIDEVTANRIIYGAQGWVGSAVDRERMVQARHLDLVHMLTRQTEKRRAEFIDMVHKLAGKTTEGQEN